MIPENILRLTESTAPARFDFGFETVVFGAYFDLLSGPENDTFQRPPGDTRYRGQNRDRDAESMEPPDRPPSVRPDPLAGQAGAPHSGSEDGTGRGPGRGDLTRVRRIPPRATAIRSMLSFVSPRLPPRNRVMTDGASLHPVGSVASEIATAVNPLSRINWQSWSETEGTRGATAFRFGMGGGTLCGGSGFHGGGSQGNASDDRGGPARGAGLRRNAAADQLGPDPTERLVVGDPLANPADRLDLSRVRGERLPVVG